MTPNCVRRRPRHPPKPERIRAETVLRHQRQQLQRCALRALLACCFDSPSTFQFPEIGIRDKWSRTLGVSRQRVRAVFNSLSAASAAAVRRVWTPARTATRIAGRTATAPARAEGEPFMPASLSECPLYGIAPMSDADVEPPAAQICVPIEDLAFAFLPHSHSVLSTRHSTPFVALY